MSEPQWQRIARHYKDQIDSGELSPGTRIPSDAKLAEIWSVSRPTAHRALHELQRMGLVLRSKGAGTIVAEPDNRAKGRVALIVDRMVQRYNFPHSDLIRGIQDGLGEEVSIVVSQSDSDIRREARQLEKMRTEADAIIIYPTADPRNNALMQRIYDSGTPLVVLDRFPEGLHVDAVESDNVGATEAALRLLKDRGHTRIAFFSFHKPDFSSVAERHAAYLEVVGPEGQALTRWFPQAIETEPRQLVQAVQDALFVLVNRDRATALFCVEDIIAAAAIDATEYIGLRVPEDFEIALFNDWPPMMLRTSWALHRIVQNPYGLGRAAAELVQNRLRDRQTEPQIVRVPADLFPAEQTLPIMP